MGGLDAAFVRKQLMTFVKDVMATDDELELDSPFMEGYGQLVERVTHEYGREGVPDGLESLTGVRLPHGPRAGRALGGGKQECLMRPTCVCIRKQRAACYRFPGVKMTRRPLGQAHFRPCHRTFGIA